jgi:hypothetical protein
MMFVSVDGGPITLELRLVFRNGATPCDLGLRWALTLRKSFEERICDEHEDVERCQSS